MRTASGPDAPHLVAERHYYVNRTATLEPIVKEVLAELRARTPDTERSVSRVLGQHLYYTVTPPGHDLPQLRRKSDGGPEQDLIDLADAGSTYAAFGVAEPNSDGVLLAYSLDTTGAERYTLRFRDMTTGMDLPGEWPDTYYTGAWAGRFFFYTVIDELNRPCAVHRIDPLVGEHAVVLTEPDQRFELTVERSGDFIVIASHSRTTSECWAIPAADPTAEPISLRGRTAGIEYDVEWDVDRWLVVSNAEQTEFALTAPASDSAPALHVRDGRIHDVVALADAIVTYSRIDGAGEVRILNRDGTLRHLIGPFGGRRDTTRSQ